MKYLKNEQLKKHTSFRIGGPADYFVSPENIEELKTAFLFAKNNRLPYTIIGAGTNLLALDKGFRGLVIQLFSGFNSLKAVGNTIIVGAGCPLTKLIKFAADRGLTGLEEMIGIPGTVGGAVKMNAGAWGKELGGCVEALKVMDDNGDVKTLKKKMINFSYRKGPLQSPGLVALEATIKLRPGGKKAIQGKMAESLAKRRETQPLGIPNAGCIFKNPKSRYAGKLLEDAQCKGMRIGDAQVSEKHANFIVNLGEAKACEVIKLMAKLQQIVKNKYKIKLEPEIKIMVESQK